mmetsp:Transcript_17380/g.43286  ORF Transcript_17380/g.43286 Transcript_17380/m.43286 type:complete len:83 (-) Transcript_17380:326-574(-)
MGKKREGGERGGGGRERIRVVMTKIGGNEGVKCYQRSEKVARNDKAAKLWCAWQVCGAWLCRALCVSPFLKKGEGEKTAARV